MEKAWLFDTIAVTIDRVDFVDPAVADEPDARERGVRVEVRPIEARTDGSIYVSSSIALKPAVCRIDLLESRPGAADRMHWHPSMHDGEPRKRVFDQAMPADPVGWLAEKLRNVHEIIDPSSDVSLSDHEVSSLTAATDDIVGEVEAGLAWARQPWPDVRRNHRGLADTN